MASFRKHGDTWEYRIRYYDVTGKRKEISKRGFKTKAEARKAAEYVSVDIQEGVVSELNKKVTVRDYLKTWFELYKPTVKVSSHRNRATTINQINSVMGDVLLVNLTSSLYQKYLNQLAEKYAKNTLMNIQAVMGMMSKQAIRDGYFMTNITVGIRIPKATDDVFVEESDEEEIVFWETEDIVGFHSYYEKYFNSKQYKHNTRHARHLMYEKQRDYVMIMTGLYAGLRIGEICSLKSSDIDLENDTINVNKTYVVLNGQRKDDFVLGPPKTKSSRRTVPIVDILKTEVTKMLKYQKEFKMMFRDSYSDDGFIFTDKTGHPIPPRNMRYKLRTLVGKAKVHEITPHGLRHTYTSLMIESGVPLKEIQVRLGHSTSATTLDIYSHINKNVTINSNDQMNDTINRFLSK